MKKLIILVFLGLFSYGFAETKCVTPNGEDGQCVSILDCAVLRNAIAKNVSTELNEFVQESLCGYIERPYLFVCCGSTDKFTYNRDPKMNKNFGLLPKECGNDTVGDNKLLIGSTHAGLNQYPWLALLEYRKNGKSSGYKCGGVLINNRYVLTAAHCIREDITAPAGKLFRVRLGEHDLRTDPDCEDKDDDILCTASHQDIEVEEVVESPRYTRDGQYHDIALVRLARPAVFINNVQPICLPINIENSVPGNELILAGWGKTATSSMSDVKEKFRVSVVNRDTCSNMYNKANRHLLDSQFCAQADQDICKGNGGGPLVKQLPSTSRYYVEGILSFGPRICSPTWPEVYTKVSKYIIWILDNMKP